ncbi:TPA: hypothetical protein DF272_02135 [Candidatus Falkowbacteria bacterium]|nr:hypothetical protein [Candidatus Falkowbacteria bacterium]
MPNFNLPILTLKKILMVIGFILITGALAFAIYYLFFRGPVIEVGPEELTPEELSDLPLSGERKGEETGPTGPEVPGVTESLITRRPANIPTETTTETAAGGVTSITDLDLSITPFMSLDASGNNLMSYNSDTDQFYRIDGNGKKTLLSERRFPEVKNITWAENSEKAIMEFPDGTNVLYNFQTQTQTTLPANWTDFDFSSTESQIAFKDMDANVDKRFIGTSSADGSGQKYVEFLGNKDNKVKVNWSPNNQIIATYEKATSGEFNTLYFIGPNNENYRSLDVNGFGVQLQFNPDGDKMVYSAHNSVSENKPQLYVTDASPDAIGYNHKKINLNTWADKCTFANASTMYCAVPKIMPEGAGWFPELADNEPDNIYKVDVNTGATSFIAEPEFEYTINQMQVSQDGSSLFFTDKQTNTVHKIKLK